MRKVNISLDLDLSNEADLALYNSLTGAEASATKAAAKPKRKSAAEKKAEAAEAAKIEAAEAAAKEAATAPAEAGGVVSMDEMKQEMAAKIDEHRAAIKAELALYKVKKMSLLDVEDHADFLAFLKAL